MKWSDKSELKLLHAALRGDIVLPLRMARTILVRHALRVTQGDMREAARRLGVDWQGTPFAA